MHSQYRRGIAAPSGSKGLIAMPTDSQPNGLKAVFRASQILRKLRHGPMTVTEVAAELDVHKSTAHRLLGTLESAGFLMRNIFDRRYYVGPLVSELAADPIVTHQYLLSCAVLAMQHVAEVTRESVALNMLVGVYGITLHEIPSSYDLQIVGKKRVNTDLYSGAGYKALLAQLGPKELSIIVNNQSYKPRTERTIVRPEELLVQLDRVREQGYAMSYGERIPEAMNISVMVRNYMVPLALAVLGPESRMKPRTEEFLGELLAARDIVEKNIARAFGSPAASLLK